MSFKKYLICILATILVFGIGLGVGLQITKTVEPIEAEEVVQDEEPVEENPNVLVNKELGFELQIPQKWIDKNYYTKTKDQTSIFDESKVIGKKLIVMADFEDWEGFDLLHVVRLESGYWEELKKAEELSEKHNEIIREQSLNINWDEVDSIFEQRYGYPMPEEYKNYGLPSYIELQFTTFHEDSEFVYYITKYGHDAPDEYFEDKWHELYPADLRDMIKKI